MGGKALGGKKITNQEAFSLVEKAKPRLMADGTSPFPYLA